MPQFSPDSLQKLSTVDERLQQICNEVIKKYDFRVIIGHRNQEDQGEAVRSGKSKTPWPTSKHNSKPSMAVDLAPCPIDWEDIDRFHELNAYMQVEAANLGYKIIWGGSFISLKDYDHWELV